MLERIVSGGQTGVDRAALDCALELGIAIGGWCPAGRRAEDGIVPDRYPLQETRSRNYAERTRLNIRDSDGTLIISQSPLSGGTALTERLARASGKPVLIADPGRVDPQAFVAWIEASGITVLNVAGPRENGEAHVYQNSRDLLESYLSAVV